MVGITRSKVFFSTLSLSHWHSIVVSSLYLQYIYIHIYDHIWIHIIYTYIIYIERYLYGGFRSHGGTPMPLDAYGMLWMVKKIWIPKYQRPRKAWWWSHWATGHRWTDGPGWTLGPWWCLSVEFCRWFTGKNITRNTPDRRLVGLVMIADFYAFEMTNCSQVSQVRISAPNKVIKVEVKCGISLGHNYFIQE